MAVAVVQSDLFADSPDAEHSVRWQPADGDSPKFVPMFEAVRRLENYGIEDAEKLLREGQTLRTPFAFYALHEEVIRG
jgi:hypothetical protein